jgi:hypothetical protein
MRRTAAAAGVLALAALLGGGTAHADDGLLGTPLGGTCNGTVDTNCSYCTYQGGWAPEPVSRCWNGTSGYRWSYCTAWANGGCQFSITFTS